MITKLTLQITDDVGKEISHKYVAIGENILDATKEREKLLLERAVRALVEGLKNET